MKWILFISKVFWLYVIIVTSLSHEAGIGLEFTSEVLSRFWPGYLFKEPGFLKSSFSDLSLIMCCRENSLQNGFFRELLSRLITYNMLSLCSYDFPLSPSKYIPLYGGAAYHDYHQYVGGQSQSNFASVFTYCDYIYGTDKVCWCWYHSGHYH